MLPVLFALNCLGATPNDSPLFVLLGRQGTDGFNPNMGLDLVFCTWLSRHVVINMSVKRVELWYIDVLAISVYAFSAVTARCAILTALLNDPAVMLPMEEGVMDGIGLENNMGRERMDGQGFTFCIVY